MWEKKTLQNVTGVSFKVTELNNVNYLELNLFPNFSFLVEKLKYGEFSLEYDAHSWIVFL